MLKSKEWAISLISRILSRKAHDEAVRARNEALSYHTFASERLREARVQTYEAQQSLLLRFHRHIGTGRTRPLRVLFLVPHTSLWDVYSPIYDAMVTADEFEPTVLAFRRVDVSLDLTAREIEEFFADRGISARLEGFVNDGYYRPIDPNEYDVLFYTLGSAAYPKVYKQEATSLFFLTCYISYGFLLAAEEQYQFNQDFHHSAWRIFSSTAREQTLYEKFGLRTYPNAVQTGYPKFDLLRDNGGGPSSERKSMVIWAPHWTILQVYPRLNLGLFDQICMEMLEIFRDFPNIDFIYKPHPNLKYALEATAFMPVDKYDAYLAMMTSCRNVRIMNQGDYFPLFKESAAMITDSVSFLAEYLPTGRPLLFLDRPDRAKMSDVGEEIISLHYIGRKVSDIRKFITTQVIDGCDPLHFERMKRSPELLELRSETASARILTELRLAFGLNKN